MSNLMTSGDAGKVFWVCRERVRQFEREGRLAAAAITERGLRLFDPAAVEAFRQERAARAAAR
jgi:hypothetical protein